MLHTTRKIEYIITESYAGKYIEAIEFGMQRFGTHWTGWCKWRFHRPTKYPINAKSYNGQHRLRFWWRRYDSCNKYVSDCFQLLLCFAHSMAMSLMIYAFCIARWWHFTDRMGGCFTSATTATGSIIAIKFAKSTTDSECGRWICFKCCINMACTNNWK